MRYKFGVSEVTSKPWTFEQDVHRYAGLGVDAIEIWENKLSSDLALRLEQLRLPESRGLTVSSFQANVHSPFPTHLARKPSTLDRRVSAFRSVLETCAPELPGTVFVLNTGVAAGGDVASATERSVVAYAGLATIAHELGVRLALEPLHPLAMNEDSFLWNLEEALHVVREVAHPALGICADIWNLHGQADLHRRVAMCGDRLFLAQVSDYRRPRSFLDRLPIGKGSTDFRPFLCGLSDAGYNGPLILEIFSDNVPDSIYLTDIEAAIAESRSALERMLSQLS